MTGVGDLGRPSGPSSGGRPAGSSGTPLPRQTTATSGQGAPYDRRLRTAFSVRRLLWGSLVLVPISVLASLLGAGEVTLFILSVIALVPLAWLIGEATEQAGEYTGPAVAGLLNASFGNAPELIIALLAVNAGLFDVVRGSLSGSVISNLLLVLGCSLFVGGTGRLERRAVVSAAGMVTLAALLYVPTSVMAPRLTDTDALLAISVPVAAILICLYIVVTVRSLRREHRRESAREDTPSPDWSLPRALVTLAVATLATVAVSQVLTGSIETFADAAGLSDMFVAAVIVAIAGNAAEHGGAVVIASRGGIRLASEIALQSASQVALGVIPAVVLLSLAIRPLPLVFSGVEFLGLAVAVAVPTLLLFAGRSSRWRGAGLCAAYAVVIVAFFVAT